MKRLMLSMAITFAAPFLEVRAATFTNDALISFSDTNYDGQSILVTNCTVTIDGAHTFSSVEVLNGGKLTHSASTNGLIEDRLIITNEIHVLTGINPVALNFSNVVLATIRVGDTNSSTIFTNAVDYLVSIDTNGVVSIARTPGSAIADGAGVQVAYDVLNASVPSGLNLSVSGDFTIHPGGAIEVIGRGYGSGYGMGSGFSSSSLLVGSGAGHGGYGGLSASNTPGGTAYDSTVQPKDKGSAGGAGAGGPGGFGGGAVNLQVDGTIKVDGVILANGANGLNSRSGGGSGGSVLISAETFLGSGSILANGGAGEPSLGGGGGGGRLAVVCQTNGFAGELAARGGQGWVRGGAGTVYVKAGNATVGSVVVDNGGNRGTNTALAASEPFALTVRGGAVLSLASAQTIGSLVLASNGILWLSSFGLSVTGSALIQPGGAVLADGTGFGSAQGTGHGNTIPTQLGLIGSGAGYGGSGSSATAAGLTATGGTGYGSIVQPNLAGSGGGLGIGVEPASFGGAGGGAVRLNVAGTLAVDGIISADGRAGIGEGSGGGSGGSIWLTVGGLAGDGLISALGGPGNGLGGGGGGGRIAIYFKSNTFTGTLRAWGGSNGINTGGAGTIYTRNMSQAAGQVLVDNHGNRGTNTLISTTEPFDLTVRSGAVIALSGASTVGSLTVGSNSLFLFTNLSLTVTHDASIQPGGEISANGSGFPGGTGNGAGRSATYFPFGQPSIITGGGAGHGGFGSASAVGAAGGNAYDSVASPFFAGSGGGVGIGGSPTNAGGAGGGIVRMTVTGSFVVDGKLSADGLSPAGLYAGGGAGGSIVLTVGTLAGSGLISANGGAGNNLGGGGGGGRIAMTYQANLFAGAMQALGGGSTTNIGGAGTVYLKSLNQAVGQVLVDNGGRSGTNTSAGEGVSLADFVVRGGASLIAPIFQMNSLFIGSNSWMRVSNSSLSISGNATVEIGGAILADGTGFGGGLGLGAGRSGGNDNPVSGGGGGYGGYGGAGNSRFAFGGTGYGGMLQALTTGSGGGGGLGLFPTNAGGAGGGAIRMTIGGSLTVNGRISANGASGVAPNTGGGSGGGISIAAANLAGIGSITANGGAGQALGGGGGGGRIVLQPVINVFSGSVTAFGGPGNHQGGAGLIYTKAPNQSVGLLLIDNGGPLGTNTSLLDSGSFDLTVMRGGIGFHSTFGFSPRTLTIFSNGWITISNQTLNVSSSANIQAGGGIIADGTGAGPGLGLGAGFYSPVSFKGGGGYGGAGGGNPAGFGRSYGQLQTPFDVGSGGANSSGSSSTSPLGGSGGGALHLVVTGPLAVDGRISANGAAGELNSGGGSGGSVWISAGTLLGAGTIAANGGNGNGAGGGGGGGRIGISFINNNLFTGTMSAVGGTGAMLGGAGTIFVKSNLQAVGSVVLDNGGQLGTNSSLGSSQGQIDVTLSGGARLMVTGFESVRNLTIASNAFLTFSSQDIPVNVSGNVTVQAGGGIVADGMGFTSGQVSGGGSTLSSGVYGTTGGGGSHGGIGASSVAGAAGGTSTDSALFPVLGGGAGGGGQGSVTGGPGGGVIDVNVSGALVLQGRVSADGLGAAAQGSGGGAGGAINLRVGSLSGAGAISANGGTGNGYGGGGGGGRILIASSNNSFSGVVSAFGGAGFGWGGAGTIYVTHTNAPSTKLPGQMTIDNGGRFGARTPLADSGPIDLQIQNGAWVEPANDYLTVSNLLIAANGTLSAERTNFDLAVLNNATLDASGALSADARGYRAGNGPGAGISTNLVGSGGGYGGAGGASSLAPGGLTYGSAEHPMDLGSGGGRGAGFGLSGSEGGGAIRLNVGGTLTVNGNLTAEGNAAVDDSAGGGSGGSLWVNANVLEGSGVIAADGGSGELYQGGGGGGGRIALFSRMNHFVGTISALGGDGFAAGGDGTITIGTNLEAPTVIAQSPTGVVTTGVSLVDLVFNTAIQPGTVSAADMFLTGPIGTVSNLNVAAIAPTKLRISFPLVTAPGVYTVSAGPQITDLFGQAMSQAYIGNFTLNVPVIQGTITDTNGQPVPGIVLQPSMGSPATTDTNGVYVLGFSPGSSLFVAPVSASLIFVPASRSYSFLSGSVSNQDYLAVTTIVPALTSGQQGTNFILGWSGLAGVRYDTFYSTNLVNWLPYISGIPGTNGPMQLLVPLGQPVVFFRIQATN